jgi:F-type H+-transporting ATPase subunit delta
MGGIRVAYGNFVLDGSVRGALDRLKDRLIYDVLKQN